MDSPYTHYPRQTAQSMCPCTTMEANTIDGTAAKNQSEVMCSWHRQAPTIASNINILYNSPLPFFSVAQYFMRESNTHIRFDYTSIWLLAAFFFSLHGGSPPYIYGVGFVLLHSRLGPIFCSHTFCSVCVCLCMQRTSARRYVLRGVYTKRHTRTGVHVKFHRMGMPSHDCHRNENKNSLCKYTNPYSMQR